jgi:ClpP class serine protease
MLRQYFPDIKAFIPQMALSGATLIALSCNALVMGAASRLSLIDVQVGYGDSQVSAYSVGKALSRLTEYFRTVTAEEAPYPWRAMAEKLDPVVLESWSTSLGEIARYANELLLSAGYSEEKCRKIIKELVLTRYNQKVWK